MICGGSLEPNEFPCSHVSGDITSLRGHEGAVGKIPGVSESRERNQLLIWQLSTDVLNHRYYTGSSGGTDIRGNL